jgi:hypothetical protein
VVAKDPHFRIDQAQDYWADTLDALKTRLARAAGRVGAALLRPRGLMDRDVRDALWRRGVAAQPAGFYSSLVNPSEVGASDEAQPFANLDLNPATQLRYLTDVFPRYQREYESIRLERPADWDMHPRFFRHNDAFEALDPLVYWGMIRTHRPERIVEIGSGFSTLLAAEAVRVNGGGSITAIDPYPREFIRRNDLAIDLRVGPVEDIGLELLLSLKANDIVFIDSSHVMRRGGDVVWFFLSVLPALRDGVIVHVHDVHFPFDYPRMLIVERNVYWTEQYLLHAYLLKNMSDEVLFASRFSAERFPHECRAAFPDVERLNGASFWMRVHKTT